jgi:hypothetical protein
MLLIKVLKFKIIFSLIVHIMCDKISMNLFFNYIVKYYLLNIMVQQKYCKIILQFFIKHIFVLPSY